MKISLRYLVLFSLVLSACLSASPTPTSQPPLTQPLPGPTLTRAGMQPALTSTIPTPTAATTALSTATSSPTAEPTPTIVVTPMGFPVIQEQPGPLYTTLFSIPVGEGKTIQYRGGNDPDTEINGPNAIAVLPDDSFVIADLVANRLLHFDNSGNLLGTIELDDLGIANVADLRVQGDELFLLEISLDFSPPRYRVNQLSFDGKLIASHEIPEGFHIEDGLTGIAIDCEGQIVLELGNGFYLHRLQDVQNNSGTAGIPNGYACHNRLYQIAHSNKQSPAMIVAGNIRYETALTTGLGGLTLLKVFDDGSLYTLREDVINNQIIQVDLTVHYTSADGMSQGMARVPRAEAYYYVMRSIVISSKGEAFVLLPRRNSVEVVRLNFYQHLEPFEANAVVPQLTVSTRQP